MQTSISAANKIRVIVRKGKLEILTCDDVAWVAKVTEFDNGLPLVLPKA